MNHLKLYVESEWDFDANTHIMSTSAWNEIDRVEHNLGQSLSSPNEDLWDVGEDQGPIDGVEENALENLSLKDDPIDFDANSHIMSMSAWNEIDKVEHDLGQSFPGPNEDLWDVGEDLGPIDGVEENVLENVSLKDDPIVQDLFDINQANDFENIDQLVDDENFYPHVDNQPLFHQVVNVHPESSKIDLEKDQLEVVANQNPFKWEKRKRSTISKRDSENLRSDDITLMEVNAEIFRNLEEISQSILNEMAQKNSKDSIRPKLKHILDASKVIHACACEIKLFFSGYHDDGYF